MKNLKNVIKILWDSSKGYFILTFILSIFSSVPNIMNLYIWKKILDIISEILNGKNANYLSLLIYIIAHLFFKTCTSVMSRSSQYIQKMFAYIVQKYITKETIDIISVIQLSDMENSEVHNLIEKANLESGDKVMGILGKLVELLQSLTTFIGMSGILLSFNAGLYIIVFLSVLPMALHSQKYFKKIFDIYEARMEKIRYKNELRNILNKSEIFKELKIFGAIEYIKEKILDIINSIMNEEGKIKKSLNKQGTLSEVLEILLSYVLKICVIFVGIKSKITIGTIIMNTESIGNIQSATSTIVLVGISIYEDCLYLNSFTTLQQYKSKIINQKNACKLINKFKIEEIEFIDVWFKYTEESEYVIKGFSHKFTAGKTYAIVGFNGGGKTTLIKLIMYLYKPQKGTILINGMNIERYDRDAYFNQISVVFQDFAKYPLTVRENIGIGSIAEMNSQNSISSAAKFANADIFINNLPNSYEEKLLRGWAESTDLSIGQWQRIAIARAHMRAGTLNILDEPSASLDAKSERDILNNYVNGDEEKISIIITHRFLNIKKMSEIIVLKEGKIEAFGNHTYLLEVSEVYSELYHSQKELI